MDVTSIDELFDGQLATAVPTPEQLHASKAPGDADGEDEGDHCSVQV
jgi:hypothetical protein